MIDFWLCSHFGSVTRGAGLCLCRESSSVDCMAFIIFFLPPLSLTCVTKSSPEAYDLHAIWLLKLKFVSVSMTMNEKKKNNLHCSPELNINLASASSLRPNRRLGRQTEGGESLMCCE